MEINKKMHFFLANNYFLCYIGYSESDNIPNFVKSRRYLRFTSIPDQDLKLCYSNISHLSPPCKRMRQSQLWRSHSNCVYASQI